MTRADGAILKNPKQVMNYILFQARPVQHILFQPQHTFVTGDDGALLADHVGRVEDMQASYDLICERIGIPSAPLGQVNSSRRGSYRDYYDDALRDSVAALYRRDLELFGYGF